MSLAAVLIIVLVILVVAGTLLLTGGSDVPVSGTTDLGREFVYVIQGPVNAIGDFVQRNSVLFTLLAILVAIIAVAAALNRMSRRPKS